jgi:hypothetical protein
MLAQDTVSYMIADDCYKTLTVQEHHGRAYAETCKESKECKRFSAAAALGHSNDQPGNCMLWAALDNMHANMRRLNKYWEQAELKVDYWL